MKTLIAFILLFSAFAFGQNSKKDVYKIRAKGKQLIVTFGGKSHALDASEHIDAAKITGTQILFASRNDDFTYLLVDVSGESREKQNDRQCGAGTEANLIWIKLDAKWRVAGIKSERYESCWSSVTSNEGYKISGETLTVEFDNFRDDKRVKLFYNNDEPEKGLQKEETPLETDKTSV